MIAEEEHREDSALSKPSKSLVKHFFDKNPCTMSFLKEIVKGKHYLTDAFWKELTGRRNLYLKYAYCHSFPFLYVPLYSNYPHFVVLRNDSLDIFYDYDALMIELAAEETVYTNDFVLQSKQPEKYVEYDKINFLMDLYKNHCLIQRRYESELIFIIQRMNFRLEDMMMEGNLYQIGERKCKFSVPRLKYF